MSEKAKVNEGQEREPETGQVDTNISAETRKLAEVAQLTQQPLAKRQELAHHEATCIVYTTFIVGGVELNMTMREGATAEGVKALLLEMGQVSKWLKSEMKATPVWNRDTRETIAQYRRKTANDKTEKPTTQPPAPVTTTPPPAPTQVASPPPATGTPPALGQAAAPAPVINKVTVEDIDFMRITAPSGKAVVEFWRKGRTYPEVRWQRSGEMLLEVAPVLASVGFVAGHFDIESVGQEYQRPMKVSWIPSPKNPKWRDLTKIVLVQET